jgi:DNA-binding transcriptional regulator YiaG
MRINKEFIELQRRAGLSNRNLSIIANVSEHTVQAWRKGESAVPKLATEMINRFIGFKG